MSPGAVGRRGTNTTTHFFREPRALELVRDLIAGPRRAEGKTTRVWCVGCSSGDEPYSLAIVCREADRPVQVLASDVNPDALATALRAEYPARHLRHVEEPRRARWFREAGGRYRVADEARGDVRFLQHDITTEAAPGHDFDAVFCRNVMVYFTRLQAGAAVATMLRALRPGGLLVIGASEWLPGDVRERARDAADVELEERSGVMVYRKQGATPILAARPEPGAVGRQGAKDAGAGPDRRPGALPVIVVGRAPTEATAAAASDAAAAELERVRTDGDRLLDSGRADDALAVYLRGLERDPLLADLHLRAGLCHLLAGRPGPAREALRRCLFLEPQLWPAWLLLADLAAKDDPGQARVCLERAHKLLDSNTAARLASVPGFAPFVRDERAALDALRRRLRG